MLTGSKLKTIKQQNIFKLKDMSCYRGIRHTRQLPVRGQRTSTNAKTCRGKTRRKIKKKKKNKKKG